MTAGSILTKGGDPKKTTEKIGGGKKWQGAASCKIRAVWTGVFEEGENKVGET